MPRDDSYSKAFREKINELELRALNAGTNLTAICRDIKISRSTPDRWRRRIPRTIRIVEKMEARVSTVEKEKRTVPMTV